LGKQIDARSDLYGLGATAFYAFSGRFPFEGKSATEVLAKQVTEPAPPLASLGLAVPRKLASLVDRCLAKNPEHRPATAQALAEQLGVALEQRRELPAALRAFVKRDGLLNGPGTLFGGLAILPVSIAASQLLGMTVGYRLGLVAGYGTFVVGLFGAPFAYFVYAARRLMSLGFAHGDIGPAYKAEIEQNNEEIAVAQRTSSPTLKRVLSMLPKAFLGVFALSVATLMFGPQSLFRYASPLIGLSLGATFFSTIALLAFWQRHEDVDTEFWAKVWMGRIGKAAFSVARKLLGNRVRQSAMTHRATELSLGMAAEQLYDSLPKETRLALGDLPVLLKRLQGDAQSLRKRHDELQEALGETADAASPEYAEVRALRDSIHAKLGDAVGALETIRLNLLRLHAGSATVEGLTTHLGLAADVSEEVERLIAAHEEVERSLKFPRQPASTPV
jgi:serine/threonine-protein kinase